MKNNKNNTFSWGEGLSDLFVDVLDDGYIRVLDIEYDSEELCRRCGGEVYYRSCSGLSGAARLMSLGSLLPIGVWRTDTVRYAEAILVPVGMTAGGYEIRAALPYASHRKNKFDLFDRYPVVIRVVDQVIYCDFRDFLGVISKIISDEALEGRFRELEREFAKADGEEWQERIEFYDLSSSAPEDKPDPWVFFAKELESYSLSSVVWHNDERMWELLSVEKMPLTGEFFQVRKIGGHPYRTRRIQNPLEKGAPLTAGWQRLADDTLVRFYQNEAHIACYTPARAAFAEQARRLARKMGGEQLVDSILGSDVFEEPNNQKEFLVSEKVVPKVQFLLNKEALLSDLRNELIRAARKEVFYAVQNMGSETQKAILETIPDDAIVTKEDSLESGEGEWCANKFKEVYFSDQTGVTAAKLKQHADEDSVVMRALLYVALR